MDQLKFAIPQIDGRSADVVVKKIAGPVADVHRPLRQGSIVMFFGVGHISQVTAKTKKDKEGDSYVERTEVISTAGDEDVVFWIDEEVLQAAGTSYEALHDAMIERARKDREIMNDAFAIPGVVPPTLD